MSAIQSLLRVMTLRDAEAIVLEAGKVPSLRRRGQVESLAMPALEAKMLAEFTAPLLEGRAAEGRAADEWPAVVPFQDPDGSRYQCTIERVAAGLRVVVRPGKPVPAAAAPPPPPPAADSKPHAWWAKPAPPAPTPSGAGTAAAPAAPAITPAAHAPAVPLAAPAPAYAPAYAPAHAPYAPDPAAATRDALLRLARLLEGPVALAREHRASDVLLSTGRTPRLRIDGRLEQVDVPVDDAELAACVAGLGTNTDHGLELAGTRLRVNAFDHLSGVGVAARLIRDRVPSLADLGLPPELLSVVEQRDGLVLACGPTGSGKSTTLAALVDQIDQRRAAHVITLEDPIEYRFEGRRCLIHQREVGQHVPSFAVGLKAALREAPDVILLGELRDRDTIATALTAAETGHLVLATLHAPNATGAIDRMIDAFPDGQQRQIRWQLAAVLRTVITQYLLPRRDGGRAAAAEVVPVTPAVANIIRKGDLHTLPTAIQSGRDAGMIPLERSLARLVESGLVAPQVVKRVAADHDLLAALAGKLR
ncbi:MAG TPA: PilT/PilU family type 4a pilus ATPase [Kofleriaceae bacterium]|nr:PilT/PilU family type 4a pilus ATPase [Kofleriaceae bacterium]